MIFIVISYTHYSFSPVACLIIVVSNIYPNMFLSYSLKITDTRTLKNQNGQICTSEECLRSAANLRLSMDLKVDPCDDFYKFTCGRWDAEHPDNVWHYEYSNFETVKERTTTKLLAFLESNVSDSEPSPLKKMRDFYTSCTDTGLKHNLRYITTSIIIHIYLLNNRDSRFTGIYNTFQPFKRTTLAYTSKNFP